MMLDAIWRILTELAPWLLLGTLIAAVLHVVLPRNLVRQQLRGYWGVVKAVLLGVPMPLCSCGVIPAGLGLKRDGASDGAAVGFLISTPQTGVDSILVSASFLGWPFALFKVVSAGITGLVGGWWAEAASGSAAGSAGRTQVTVPAPSRTSESPSTPARRALRRVRDAAAGAGTGEPGAVRPAPPSGTPPRRPGAPASRPAR